MRILELKIAMIADKIAKHIDGYGDVLKPGHYPMHLSRAFMKIF